MARFQNGLPRRAAARYHPEMTSPLVQTRRLDPGTAGIAAGLYTRPDRRVDRDEMRAFLTDPAVWFVAAFLNGRPVGYVYAHVLARPDQPRPRCVVFELWVEPSSRRRGVASTLVGAVRGAMRDKEARVWVLVDSANTGAVDFVTATGGVRPSGVGPMMTYPRGPA